MIEDSSAAFRDSSALEAVIEDSLAAFLEAAIEDSLAAFLEAAIEDSLAAFLEAAIEDSLAAFLEAAIEDSFLDSSSSFFDFVLSSSVVFSSVISSVDWVVTGLVFVSPPGKDIAATRNNTTQAIILIIRFVCTLFKKSGLLIIPIANISNALMTASPIITAPHRNINIENTHSKIFFTLFMVFPSFYNIFLQKSILNVEKKVYIERKKYNKDVLIGNFTVLKTRPLFYIGIW